MDNAVQTGILLGRAKSSIHMILHKPRGEWPHFSIQEAASAGRSWKCSSRSIEIQSAHMQFQEQQALVTQTLLYMVEIWGQSLHRAHN